MNPFGQLFSVLHTSLAGNASRTDGLRPLAWIVGMLLTSLVATAFTDRIDWVPSLLGAALVLYLGLYAFSYLHCLLKNPDLLRSETYNIQKQAIDKGWIGDSSSGLFKSNDLLPVESFPPRAESKIEHQRIEPIRVRELTDAPSTTAEGEQ